ncbi:MAG: DUF4124 domain-containing protein, partial [Pseudomonadota bacterium]
MRRRSSMSGISMAGAVAAVLAVGAPAGAGTLYRWQTESGTLAFADDPKRIPERYRDVAEEIQTDGLDGYERFTPTDGAAQQTHEARLAERLDGLRARTGVAQLGGSELAGAGSAAGSRHPLTGIALQSVGRVRADTEPGHGRQRTTSLATMDQPVPILGVSPDPDSDEPIVVERMRARSKDSLT